MKISFFSKKRLLLLILIFCCAKAGFAQISAANLQKDSIKIDGLQRTFYYYKSKEITNKPRLIFALHGSTGSGLIMRMATGQWFETLADKYKNTIIVYPDGYKNHWNECRKEANFDANLLNINDLAFFEQMIKYFEQKYKINSHEVSVIGHSNGGHMVYRLAKERPNLFKKFVAVSANLPTPENDDCYAATNKPASIMIINGTSDPINPYNGGEVIMTGGAKRGKVLSTDETVKYWTNLDKCGSTNVEVHHFADTDSTDHSTASEFIYKCKKKEVRLIKVENGGHILSIPTKLQMPKALGNANKDINMVQIAFDFFLEK